VFANGAAVFMGPRSNVDLQVAECHNVEKLLKNVDFFILS
jgi:hypothetical protein